MMNPHLYPQYPTDLKPSDTNPYQPLLANGMYHHMTEQRVPPLNGTAGSPHCTQPTGGPKLCGGCGGKIVERFLFHAMDRFWHHSCLKCSCCGATLADLGGSCFTKAGMILCKQDYVRMFGSTGACSACGQIIPASELVMRAGAGNVYHLNCFTCIKCHVHLVPGDRFSLIDGTLVCEQDCEKLKQTTGRKKVGRPRRSRD